ncbi:D-alanyl-D-alanine carboxypeptidase family protein [Thermoflavimicrobium daqui]|uniref:serine-type D-Ala-D-Ala carboxypeptidase n=1 Tax=Thermoflavimicrobium daqui TaxID=2137476 RepID=A0A364K3L1_9BACL|nr:D-alanyl-D-alanine carboxypeptidase family protein [Thermoflavimicrobium daqui]RAL23419.1 D-alanyl-D-alanine carboxypeptidase [Thermoflavimicrobium daqui]
MKHRWGFGLGILLFVALTLGMPVQGFAQTNSSLSNLEAKAYFMMDYETGTILAEEKSETKRPPASMTKLMTAFLVLDEIKAGKLKWEDQVKIGKRPGALTGEPVPFKTGTQETVRDLVTAMMVKSSNSAAVALAEHIGQTEDQFADMMNQKAKQLKMHQTKFFTASGLDKASYKEFAPKNGVDNRMSAHDTAILARELMKQHGEILDITKQAKVTIHVGETKQKLENTNDMLSPKNKYYVDEVDGLKTGFTDEAGACFVGTAKKGNMRLITVVMKSSKSGRFKATKKLLTYAFDNYQVKPLKKAGESIAKSENLTIPNGVERTVPMVLEKDLQFPIHKGEESKYTFQVTKDHVQAPIKKGQTLGKIKVLYNGQEVKGLEPFKLVAQTDVEEASSIRLFFREIGDTISGWFS